jgi:PKD repeat protein
MASPHVAGVAALYLEANAGAAPATVRNALYDATTKGIVSSSNTANNHLLYSLVSGGGGTTNNPPSASFSVSCSGLTCSFTDTSTDSDGSIATRSWTFGDGGTSTAANPSHTYTAGGTYSVQLTVTDNEGETDSASQNVTVSSGGSGGITLSASGYKVRGVLTVDLVWSGAGSTSVNVYRNGSVIATTANDGTYTDNTGQRGGATLTYRVCEAGTSTCSADAVVNF